MYGELFHYTASWDYYCKCKLIIGAKIAAIYLFRFVAINGVGVYLYAIVYQAQDEEEYGGAWEVFKEGMLSSSAFFVVSGVTI